MSDTTISWTNKTWNPVVGCSHVSDGCRNCYAERIYRRFHKGALPWTAENAGANIHCIDCRLGQPSRWRKPSMVFVNSMSDLFHEQVPDEFILKVFSSIHVAGWHTYQILTKRPKRMIKLFNDYHLLALPNVWLGVSVENQREADERIPYLLQTPAAVRFLSCEPLLEDIDLEQYLDGSWSNDDGDPNPVFSADWVIVGGESGPGYRPMELDWARSIRDKCITAGVPFFFKQESAARPGTNATLDGKEWKEFPR